MICQKKLMQKTYSRAVVEEGHHPSVETLPDRVFALSHQPVFLADSARSTRLRDPRKTEGAARKVAIREHVGQAEVVVVHIRIQVEEVGHVHVLRAEGVVDGVGATG